MDTQTDSPRGSKARSSVSTKLILVQMAVVLLAMGGYGLITYVQKLETAQPVPSPSGKADGAAAPRQPVDPALEHGQHVSRHARQRGNDGPRPAGHCRHQRLGRSGKSAGREIGCRSTTPMRTEKPWQRPTCKSCRQKSSSRTSLSAPWTSTTRTLRSGRSSGRSSSRRS